MMPDANNGTVYLIPSAIDDRAVATIPAYIVDAVKTWRMKEPHGVF